MGNYGVEQRLVDELTAASGIKTQPSASDLLKFSKQSATLSQPALLAMLLLKLASNNPWATHLKSLFGLEQLLNSENNSTIRRLLDENKNTSQVASLFELSSSTNATVKAKAVKV